MLSSEAGNVLKSEEGHELSSKAINVLSSEAGIVLSSEAASVLSSEVEEEHFQEKLLYRKVTASQNVVCFYDNITNTDTRKMVSVATIEDFPDFVSIVCLYSTDRNNC